MAPATPDGRERLGIGQLLVRLLAQFRQEMLAAAAGSGYGDIRPPHVHVLANMRMKGVRLTDLAARCQLSLAATSEFVSELESLGYLQRLPDPDDGRAKLIVFSERGRHLHIDAGKALAGIEADWGALVGERRYEAACQVLQEVLDQLAARRATVEELLLTHKMSANATASVTGLGK